jgi:hypothetical protein
MGKVILGCSGWNYPDTADKGGWTGVFYPDKDTKRLRYYSQFFNTAEMDSDFPTYNEVKITVSGIPGQTGESVTDVDLIPSPCSAQNNPTCTGFSDITIPGIGEGHLLVIFHNHKATATHPPVLEPVILIFIAASLLFLPTLLTSTGFSLYGDSPTPQATAPITTPVGTGQVTIQLS